MMITKTMIAPSRDDAVRLNRSEKISMIVLAYAATILDDLQKEIGSRLEMIPDGKERLAEMTRKTDELLNDLRLTVPINQRLNLQNTALDYEIRLVPRATPSETSVVMRKEEFKDLVDIARTKCRECTDDTDACKNCQLYQLLTVLLPLDDYDGTFLCPYNLGEWAN